jgi:hypothetical protein
MAMVPVCSLPNNHCLLSQRGICHPDHQSSILRQTNASGCDDRPDAGCLEGTVANQSPLKSSNISHGPSDAVPTVDRKNFGSVWLKCSTSLSGKHQAWLGVITPMAFSAGLHY